jgi:hypothetical protein
VTATLKGMARTRDTLVAFGDALRSSPLFSRVDVPIGSLAKSTDITFTLSLLLDQKSASPSVSAPPSATPIEPTPLSETVTTSTPSETAPASALTPTADASSTASSTQ